MFPAPLSRDHPNFLSKQMVWILKSSWSNSVTLKSTTKNNTYFAITSNFEDHWIMVSFQFISVAFQKKNNGETPGPLRRRSWQSSGVAL